MSTGACPLPEDAAPADTAAQPAGTRRLAGRAMPAGAPDGAGRRVAKRGLGAVAAALMVLLPALPSAAQPAGLTTRPSTHDLRATIDRFAAAVRHAGWVVFTEIDHAAAAQGAGMNLRPRTVVIFGNPRAGTPAMAGHPTLALDLPMRILVWQDEMGRIFVTRSTGDDLAERVFARHGISVPPQARSETDAILDGFVRRATE